MSKRFTYFNSFASIVPKYLDLFTGAFQCRSVKLERNAYSGALMSIRRSSDNAFKDFYPDSNEVLSMSSEDGSGTTLSSWIGASSGYIYIWYDQTGNGNNFMQSNTAYQPQIINAGSLIVDSNGLAAPTFDGSVSRFDVPAAFYNNAVLNNDYVISTSDTFFILYCGTANAYSFVAQAGSSSTTTSQLYGPMILYSDNSLVTPFNRNNIYLSAIGSAKVMTEEAANTTDAQWSGARYFGYYVGGAGASFNGICQFTASFPSDQSANRPQRVAYLQSNY